MPFILFSSDVIDASTVFSTLGDDTTVHVLQNIVLSTNNDFVPTIALAGDNNILRVDGTVINSGHHTVNFSGTSSSLLVGATGQLISYEFVTSQFATYFSAGEGTVTNYGEISATGVVSLMMAGSNNQVSNFGLISGLSGVQFGAQSGLGNTLTNGGTITATGDPLQTLEDNEGNGVTIGSNGARILNLEGGVIQSTIEGGSGILTRTSLGGGSEVVNFGTIAAIDGYGIYIAGLGAGQSFSIINHGSIIGGIAAIEDGSASNTFVNGGLIVGDVLMNGGDDVFRSIGNGQVVGVIDGGDGNDKLVGGALEDSIFGGADDDDLRGRAGDDTLDGGFNDDMLNGGTGDDLLSGGNGEDTVKGGAGDDTVGGGNGRDVLIGGAGADVFLFTSVGHSGTGNQRDVVTDFEDGIDLLDFSGISGTLTYRGTSGFTGTGGGELRISETGSGNTVVVVDANGDGATDMQVLVTGVIGLTGDDFVL